MEHRVEISKFEIKKPQSQISDCEIFQFLVVSIYNLKSKMTS